MCEECPGCADCGAGESAINVMKPTITLQTMVNVFYVLMCLTVGHAPTYQLAQCVKVAMNLILTQSVFKEHQQQDKSLVLLLKALLCGNCGCDR